jgi:hypothetical protein
LKGYPKPPNPQFTTTIIPGLYLVHIHYELEHELATPPTKIAVCQELQAITRESTGSFILSKKL